MVYFMKFFVDGGCRGNGQMYRDPIGSAACCLMRRYGGYQFVTRDLPSWPTPTNQRAELTAVILALKWALEKYEELDSGPYMDVHIYTDSRYAINCLTDWIYNWRNNGWQTSAGRDVANRELIEEAAELESELEDLGSVKYHWIPRSDNALADKCCNDALDNQE